MLVDNALGRGRWLEAVTAAQLRLNPRRLLSEQCSKTTSNTHNKVLHFQTYGYILLRLKNQAVDMIKFEFGGSSRIPPNECLITNIFLNY